MVLYKAVFWVIPKVTAANLCKPIHDIIYYSTSICPYESRKCGKVEENYKNSISREWKELSGEKKIFFHSVWGAITCWKNRNLIKNSRHKL